MKKLFLVGSIFLFVLLDLLSSPQAENLSLVDEQFEFYDDIANPSYKISHSLELVDKDSPEPLLPVRLEVVYSTDYNGEMDWQGIIFYGGEDWRFMDTVRVKSDSDLFLLRLFGDPIREVGNGYVMEMLAFNIPNNVIESFKDSDTCKIQYYHSPITLPKSDWLKIKATFAKYNGITYNEASKL